LPHAEARIVFSEVPPLVDSILGGLDHMQTSE